MILFDKHIFSDGWFNHQLDYNSTVWRFFFFLTWGSFFQWKFAPWRHPQPFHIRCNLVSKKRGTRFVFFETLFLPPWTMSAAEESHEPRTTLMLGLWGHQPSCFLAQSSTKHEKWGASQATWIPGLPAPEARGGKLGRLHVSKQPAGSCVPPPRKLRWQWKIHRLKMYFLLKIGIFQCHVFFSLSQGCNILENMFDQELCIIVKSLPQTGPNMCLVCSFCCMMSWCHDMIVRNCWGSSTPRVLKALAREGLYLAILLAGSRQQGKTSTFGGAAHLGQRADTIYWSWTLQTKHLYNTIQHLTCMSEFIAIL